MDNNAQFNFGLNQYLESLQNNVNENNNFYINEVQGFENKPYIPEIQNIDNNTNIDEQLKMIFEQNNINTEINEKGPDNYLKNINNTQILPIQTSSRVLPPLGPFTSLDGIDLNKLAIINAQKNNNIMFQPIQNVEEYNNQNAENTEKNIEEENKIEEPKLQNLTTEQTTTKINLESKSNEKPNSNINTNFIKKIEKNTVTKKQFKKNESEEIKFFGI